MQFNRASTKATQLDNFLKIDDRVQSRQVGCRNQEYHLEGKPGILSQHSICNAL